MFSERLELKIKDRFTPIFAVKMPVFMNPFQKHDVSDFPDVCVPLAQATRHPSVVANHKERLGSTSERPAAVDNEKTHSPFPGDSDFTVEGLRQDVDMDRALCSYRCGSCWKCESKCSGVRFWCTHHSSFLGYVLLPYRDSGQAESMGNDPYRGAELMVLRCTSWALSIAHFADE